MTLSRGRAQLSVAFNVASARKSVLSNRLIVVRVLRHLQLELKSGSNSFVSSCGTTSEPLILGRVKLGQSLETSTSITTEDDTRSLDLR